MVHRSDFAAQLLKYKKAVPEGTAGTVGKNFRENGKRVDKKEPTMVQ